MRLRILSLFLFAGVAALQASNLAYGMSLEEVRIELGHPESKMELGSKQILIYKDGTRLEFKNGGLIRENDRLLNEQSDIEIKLEPPVNEIHPKLIVEEPPRVNETARPDDASFTEGVKHVESNISISEDDYDDAYADALDRLEAEIGSGEPFGGAYSPPTMAERLTMIGISFAIEVLVTLTVLKIAFSISGFPCIIRQLILLSVAVALVGAMLDFVLQAELANPVRSGAGFIVLLFLIRQMTDVREWVTVIKIAMIARVVSLVIMWFVMMGLFSLFPRL